jgi:lysine-N-methylase
MTAKKQIVLVPGYMKKFRCIGSACEDTCCAGWAIDLDKDTYNIYKNNKDTELMPIFKSMVKCRDHEKSDLQYGSIIMNETSMCPFLDQNLLCKIHSRLGENQLSITCSLYPRYLNSVDDKPEMSATVSCPEVARLALLNHEGIVFEQIYEDESKKKVMLKSIKTEGSQLENKLQSYFWDIRFFSLSLLQNRNYRLADRLIILGIFYKKIEEMNLNNQTSNSLTFIEHFNNMIDGNMYKEMLQNINTNIKMQMIISKYILDLGESNIRGYNECREEVLLGLGYKEDDIDKISSKYEYNYRKYLAPYLNEKEYILENYLVNEYFRNQMPFGDYESIWDSYIFICALYGLVKLHLTGMAGCHKGLTDELVVRLIQSLSKTILHNKAYIDGIIKILKLNKFDSLAYLSILIKN